MLEKAVGQGAVEGEQIRRQEVIDMSRDTVSLA